jgi:HK97 family phage major capsid protein
MSEVQYDLQKAVELKREQAGLEMKANEVMHTGNTGFGAELVPGAIQTTDFLDLVPRTSPFIGTLRGYHGRNMNKIMEVPVIGEIPFHDLGSEWTTGAGALSQGKGKLPTAKVTITQKKYEFSVDVSDEEVRFVNVVDVVATIQRKLAASAGRTQEALLLNGDTVTAGTGNINSDDGAPASTAYYLGADGLRKTGLGNGVDVGTLEFADFLAVLGKLGANAWSPADVVWLFNHSTYIKALGVTEFKDSAMNGRSSTIYTGAMTNVLGSDLFVTRDFGLTEADGKISNTPANNTLGGFLAMHRDAVQYGYSGEYQIEIARIPGKWFQVFGHYFMGAAIASALVGTDKTVALGYNVTV